MKKEDFKKELVDLATGFTVWLHANILGFLESTADFLELSVCYKHEKKYYLATCLFHFFIFFL
jgi:hypothetical protein